MALGNRKPGEVWWCKARASLVVAVLPGVWHLEPGSAAAGLSAALEAGEYWKGSAGACLVLWVTKKCI